MADDENGAAPRGQESPAPDVGLRRRGPVIRTTDFVTPEPRDPRPPTPPAPGADAPPSPNFRAALDAVADPAETPRESQRLPGLSERLARLAPSFNRTPDEVADRSVGHQPAPDRMVERRTEMPPPPPSPPAAPVAQTVVLEGPRQPLLDAGMVMGSAWRHRKMVLLLVVGMAVLGGLASPFLPRKFTSTTTLYFDPQQVKLSDGSNSPPPMSQEAVLAIIDSQSQILVSRRVLTSVAQTMGLDKDKEFGGTPAATGAKLAKSVLVERQPNTYVVNLSVKSKDAEKSATIANTIVSSFLKEQQASAEGAYDSANTTLGGRLGALGEEVRGAEQAVADYKTQNNIDDNMVSTAPGTAAKRSDQLETLLLTAQGKTIAAKARYDAIAKFQIADLSNGNASPADASSNALLQLQQQYATAAANVSSLETKLGARHPQLLAARATLEGVSAAVRREITRLITSAQADYDRAQKEEDAVAKELAVQKALDNNLSGRLIEYRELQRKANAAREIYETVLKRTRQTGEEQRLLTSNVRVISQAEAPIQADGPSRTILMVGCIFGGLVLGLMFGILYAVIRLFTGRSKSRATA